MGSINKIFGIGLNKTGTSSLHEALNLLGFRSFHEALRYRQDMEAYGKLFVYPIMNEYDAFCDYPFFRYFKEFDRQYPGSTFILTIRDLDSWLKSIKLHINRNRFDPFYRGTFNRYDEANQIKRWHQHREEVKAYFSRRPQDLLVMNIIDGDGWEPLCAFLNRPIPSVPFPYRNRGRGVPIDLGFRAYKWLKRLFQVS